MGDSSQYDEDILIWSERQAAALRSLATRRDLPNDLDLANVVEDRGRGKERVSRGLELRAPDPRSCGEGLGGSSLPGHATLGR